MCPMRFILVFFSALLAGYMAWKTVRSTPAADAMLSDDDPKGGKKSSANDKQEFDLIKVTKNGFWGFVDMASGRYLWRNLRELKKDDKVQSS